LTFIVPSGSCCAILGPTGAGKTTLLYALSGALGAFSSGLGTGSVRIGGEEFNPFPRNVLFPRVGLALQEPHVQISGLRESVLEEIQFTLENIGLDEHLVESRAIDILKQMGILHLAERKPSSLSGGEMQRVALASLLVARPSVVLLDEPTTSLDSHGCLALARTIVSMKNISTVLFTDVGLDLPLVAADWILVLQKGSVSYFGSKSEFLREMGRFRDILPTEALDPVLKTLLDPASSRQWCRYAQVLGIR
jgi:energy-coupling factor transporter ATP-binding protein EcfA2